LGSPSPSAGSPGRPGPAWGDLSRPGRSARQAEWVTTPRDPGVRRLVLGAGGAGAVLALGPSRSLLGGPMHDYLPKCHVKFHLLRIPGHDDGSDRIHGTGNHFASLLRMKAPNKSPNATTKAALRGSGTAEIERPQLSSRAVPPLETSEMKSVHEPFGSKPSKELRNAEWGAPANTAPEDSGEMFLASGAHTPVSGAPPGGMGVFSFPKSVSL